jgi:hypothetical protein
MTLQKLFEILVLLYTVSNMASIGLDLNLRETLNSLRSVRLVLLTVLLPLVVWLALSSFLGTRAGKTVEGVTAGLSMRRTK